MNLDMNTVWYILSGLVALLLLYMSMNMIRQTSRGLIERFGKFNRFAEPGLNFIIPFIERIYSIDITETMVDVEQQEIITKDKLNAIVDAQVYYRVNPDMNSVKASQYNVYDYQYQIVNLARTTLRNIIGTLEINKVNSERNKINEALMKTLEKETKNWGIAVVRAELKDITPPKDVQAAMNNVVIAENKKQAAVDFATATETEADGARRAIIKKAEGEADAVRITAKARADAIKLENEAAKRYFVGNAQKLKSLQVTQASLENNTKIVITEKGIKPNVILGNLLKDD